MKFTDKIIERLTENNVIQSEDSELYQYGLEQGLFMILNFCTTMVIGLLFNMFWQSILFSLVYMPLRMNAGGYHARTPLRCYFISTTIIATSLSVISLIVQNRLICSVMVIAGATVLFALAPVEDANKPLEKIEQEVYAHRARLTLLFWVVAFLMGLLGEWQNLLATIATAIATLGIMVIIGRIQGQMNIRENA